MKRFTAKHSLRYAALGIGLIVLAAWYDPSTFFQSYLFSFVYWLALPLGAATILMITFLTGGSWARPLLGPLDCATRTLPRMFLLALPVFIGVDRIYPWAQRAAAGLSAHQLHQRLHQQAYLNTPFFVARGVLYFVLWWWIIRRISDPSRSEARLKIWSSAGLVIFGTTLTFASIDWVMSLDPHWYSTIYGMLFCIASLLGAYAWILLLGQTRNTDHTPPSVSVRLDQGNILLALVITWSYLEFFQYLIVWSGNLPEEVSWFEHRASGGWGYLVVLMALFQFSFPLVWLLFKKTKSESRTLGRVLWSVVIARAIESYWLVLPSMGRAHPIPVPSDILAFLGMALIILPPIVQKEARP
jgi:hypothetical protein